MKSIRFHNPKTIKESFILEEDVQEYFYDILHYHPEFQLTLILKGTGNVLLGDYIGRFSPGEIYLIGPNLPHVFRCDNEYYKPENELKVHRISVYFIDNTFGLSFFDLPENHGIRTLLKESQRGIKVSGAKAGEIADSIISLSKSSGLLRLTSFLICLDQIFSIGDEKGLLSSTGFAGVKDEDNDRMNLVFNYIMNNFTQEIRLETISDIACMTPTSFCRFFNKKTRKTLTEFVAGTRIGYSCKLLMQQKYSILEIAYQCGFYNISNFNRQFKKNMNCTPSEYLERALLASGVRK